MSGPAGIRTAGRLNKKVLAKYGFIATILIYPAILFLVLYVYVNVGSIVLAFQNMSIDGTRTFAGFDHFFRFFTDLAHNVVIRTSLVNSLKMYALNLVICMPLYILFSYYIFKKRFASKVLRAIVMVPSVVSSFIICMVFTKFVEGPLPVIMQKLGLERIPSLLNDARYSFGTTVFYMIWISFSTSLIVYPNAMNGIDNEIIESAAIDGANMFQELWHIVLPLIYPTISTFLITGVAGIFTNAGPLIAFYMYSAPTEVSNMGYYLTVEVLRDASNAVVKYPYLAAIGLLITAVSMPLTFLVKYLLERFGPEA